MLAFTEIFKKLAPERSENSGVGGGDIDHDLSGEIPETAGDRPVPLFWKWISDTTSIASPSYITHSHKLSVESITVLECEVRGSFFPTSREIDRKVEGDVEFARVENPWPLPSTMMVQPVTG